MQPTKTFLLLATLAACAAMAQAARPAKPEPVPLSAYNGPWAIKLVCDDFQPDRGPAVRGYAWEFNGTIKDGALLAQYGVAGAPGSARFVGQIGADGRMNVQATGVTGEPESAGANAGGPFSYTLRGRFGAAQATLLRMELRPCRATFSKR